MKDIRGKKCHAECINVTYYSIRKDVLHSGDHPHTLSLRKSRCRIVDGEQSLVCSLDLAYLAAGIPCKLLCSFPCVLGSLGDHLWLYVVELGEKVFHTAVVVVGKGYA